MDDPIISQTDMAALLGRSLTTLEVTNYNLYLKIAIIRLEDLLCLTMPKRPPLPVDLQMLLARCFSVIGEENNTDGKNVASKKVEDFQITYDTSSTETPMSMFVRLNASVIAKYSECQGKIRSGKRYDNCIRCI